MLIKYGNSLLLLDLQFYEQGDGHKNKLLSGFLIIKYNDFRISKVGRRVLWFHIFRMGISSVTLDKILTFVRSTDEAQWNKLQQLHKSIKMFGHPVNMDFTILT